MPAITHAGWLVCPERLHVCSICAVYKNRWAVVVMGVGFPSKSSGGGHCLMVICTSLRFVDSCSLASVLHFDKVKVSG